MGPGTELELSMFELITKLSLHPPIHSPGPGIYYELLVVTVIYGKARPVKASLMESLEMK